MSKRDVDKLKAMLGGDGAFERLMATIAEESQPATNEENCGVCVCGFCLNRTAHRRPGIDGKFNTLQQEDVRDCFELDLEGLGMEGLH